MFVPKSKLSKKAKRALNHEQRVLWTVSPVTRVVSPKKGKGSYNRNNFKKGAE